MNTDSTNNEISPTPLPASRDLPVAVIGAGPSALAMCKELLAEGYTPICFEKKEHIGGVFANNLWPFHLTSSSVLTAFSDFFPPNYRVTMWSSEEYVDYLDQYCHHFDLYRHIKFGTQVDQVERTGDGTNFKVTVSSCNADKKTEEFTVSAVMVCSGTHAAPKLTEIGMGTKNMGYDGDLVHSSALQWPPKKREDGKNLKVVLMGLGETGSDLALLLAEQGNIDLTLSVRTTAGWVTPRCRGDMPADLLTNRVTWGLPRMWGGKVIRFLLGCSDRFLNKDSVIRAMGRYNLKSEYCKASGPYGVYGTKTTGFLEAHEVAKVITRPAIESIGPGKKVTFADGSEMEADQVILGTGLAPSLTFLEKDFPDLVQAARMPSKSLYGHVAPTDTENRGIYFIGFSRPGFGAIPPLAEMQSRWVCGLLSGNLQLPAKEVMDKEIMAYSERRKHQFKHHADRLPTLVDFIPYFLWLARRAKCEINWSSLAVSDPKLFRRLIFGVFSPAQFRLQGAHAKPKMARERILNFPIPPQRLWALGALFVYLTSLLFSPLSKQLTPTGVGLDEHSTFSSRTRWLWIFVSGMTRSVFADIGSVFKRLFGRTASSST